MASGKHLINSTHIVSRCIKFANANRKVRRVNMERWTPTNLRDPVPTPPLGPAAKIQPLGSMEDTTWHSGTNSVIDLGWRGWGKYSDTLWRYELQISSDIHGIPWISIVWLQSDTFCTLGHVPRHAPFPPEAFVARCGFHLAGVRARHEMPYAEVPKRATRQRSAG